jgi:carbonic anhydrase
MSDRSQTTRRSFLASGATLAAALAVREAAFAAAPALHPAAQKGLDELMAGNARFVADKAQCPPLTARRLDLAEAQHPFAIIVSCSDSRVPVETVFDQIPGNIFGIRVAGNFVDDNGLGSIEYGVAALKSSLILVLGHTHCGAVKAAVAYVKDGTRQPSHIQGLVDAIEPAVKSTKGKPGDWYENATIQNVKSNAGALASRSPIVAKAVEAQTLSIAGGVYDLSTGRVTIVT